MVAVSLRVADFTTDQESTIKKRYPNACEATNSLFNNCINIECEAMLINWKWFNNQLPNARIIKIAMLLKVWNIRVSKHKTDKYMLEPLYLPAKNNNDKWIMACIYQKLYIVDNLKVNFLIKNDIVNVKKIWINIINKKIYIPEFKAIISIIA